MHQTRPLLTVLLCLAVALASADWPVERGDPALTGLGTDLPIENLRLRWRYRAADAATTLVADDRLACFGSADGKLTCLDLATGKLRWTVETRSPVRATPLLGPGSVYVACIDGTLQAYTRDGKHRWTYATGGKIHAAPNLAHLAEKPLVLVGSYDQKLHALDARTGQALWTAEAGNFLNAAAAVGNRRAVFGCCDGKLRVVNLATGKTLHAVDLGSYIPGPPALRDGLAYAATYTGELFCVDLDSGKIVWKQTTARAEKPNPTFAGPAVGETLVVLGSDDGKLRAWNRQTGKTLWTHAGRGEFTASPVLLDDRAVLACSADGRVVLLDAGTGKPLWRRHVGSAVTAPPAVTAGLILLACEDGSVLAYGAKP